MGNFSRDTFDKLKHYVGVRLQQGVPLVDADWNEQEDIRMFELQSFLKWFVGNGVPKGNDGFHIKPVNNGVPNDFIIKGGDGTPEGAGRCLVDGWEVINENDIRYTKQPLFNNTSLAEAWGVPVLEPLTTPLIGTRVDLVYLDVWEREVNSEEDTDLINPAVGVETCVRSKREWVVRVAEGTSALPTTPSGHIFYPLATLTRPGGNPVIDKNVITEDHRTTDLTLENHLSSTDNPHNVTADQIGALAISAYEFNNRATAHLVFTQDDANGASRTIDVGFTPKFVQALSSSRAKLGDNEDDYYGVNAYGNANLRESIIQLGTRTEIYKYGTYPYFRQDTSVETARLCRAVFYNETSSPKLSETISVYIGDVFESGLIVKFSKGLAGSYGYQELPTFNVKIRMLLLG